MDSDVTFRWFGVAGLEIKAGGRTLAVDPFLTRPPFRRFLHGRVVSNRRLVRQHLPSCDYVLISHSHWDHVMDAPEVAKSTGATVFGSPNTCRLLALLGAPAHQIRRVDEGEKLSLDPFRVEVLPAEHGFTPVTLGPGPVPPDLRPPLRIRDYRMDKCFSFLIEVEGYRLLVLPGEHARADFVFVVPTRRGGAYYASMLRDVQPSVVVPVHWDNLFLPLSHTSREFNRPGWMNLKWLGDFVQRTAPGTHYLVPDLFRLYNLADLASTRPQALTGDPSDLS